MRENIVVGLSILPIIGRQFTNSLIGLVEEVF